MEVEKIYFRNLRNEEIYRLFKEFLQLAETAGLADVTGVAPLMMLFLALFSKLEIGLEQVRKSERTANLRKMDLQRKSIYRGFAMMVSGFLHSPVAEKVDAARAIQIVIDTYGNIGKMAYEEATGAFDNFLETVGERCPEAIEKLGAVEWMEQLHDANVAFAELMSERFDEHVGEERVNIRAVRGEMKPLFDEIVRLVSALATLNDPEGVFKTFVERLNARIIYYRNVLARRKGRSEKDGVDEQG